MAETSSRRAVIAVAAVILATVAWLLVLKPPRRAAGGQYFYDMGSRSLYVVSTQAVAPATSPSGAEGVRAVVMTCGDCAVEADRFIAYMEKYSDEYRRILDSGEPPTPQQMQARSLIRAADGEAWLPAVDPAAQAIVNAAQHRCGSTPPVYCAP